MALQLTNFHELKSFRTAISDFDQQHGGIILFKVEITKDVQCYSNFLLIPFSRVKVKSNPLQLWYLSFKTTIVSTRTE